MAVGEVREYVPEGVVPRKGDFARRIAAIAAAARAILVVIELALEKIEDVCDAISGPKKEGM